MQGPADVIIIGSGPAGAHAALPLVEAGLNVLMIDGGHEGSPILTDGEVRNFEDVRAQNPEQYRLFLGEDFSSIPVSGLNGGLGGGMTSGNRSYVTEGVGEALPTIVENGQIIQSLATGGLGAAWGAASAYMNESELTAMGLSAGEMNKAYDDVTSVIGVSGPQTRPGVQPPMSPDYHAAAVLGRAAWAEKKMNDLNVRITQPYSAVLTSDLGGRSATKLADMDYYQDPGRSVYRPQYTIEELKTRPNFQYAGGHVVQRIEETADGAVVFAHPAGDHTNMKRWSASRVIAAAGAVNTARILMRSFDMFDIPVPLVTKPHMFAACLHLQSLGKKGPKERSSLCQLLMLDETRDNLGIGGACAQLYSYRSLLLFRLLGNIPLPAPEAMGIASVLAPSLVIADIRFPGRHDPRQFMTLTRTDMRRDILKITCHEERTDLQRASLRRIRSAMRTVGLLPLAMLDQPAGSSSHYAGTVPADDAGDLRLSTDRNGKLRQGRNIYVADAAMFRMLPSLPHTLTIMANARRVAGHVQRSL